MAMPDMAKELDPLFWTMSIALDLKRDWITALQIALVCTTVPTLKMLELDVPVSYITVENS